MKKIIIIGIIVSLVVFMGVFAIGNKPAVAKNPCTTIQDGTLLTSNGVVIPLGYDEWGYNYQAHMFNGYYGNYS